MPLLRVTDGQFGIDGDRQIVVATRAQGPTPSAYGHRCKPDVVRNHDVPRSKPGHYGEIGGVSPRSHLQDLHSSSSRKMGKILRLVGDQHNRQQA
jgi:hypothetical protein